MSEEELTKAMEGLGMDEGDGEGTILPIMQSIMQNLLSRDVLYPSLKEITEKVCELLFMLFLLIPHCINSYGLLCLFRDCKDSNSSVQVHLFFSFVYLFGGGELGRSCVSKRVKLLY